MLGAVTRPGHGARPLKGCGGRQCHCACADCPAVTLFLAVAQVWMSPLGYPCERRKLEVFRLLFGVTWGNILLFLSSARARLWRRTRKGWLLVRAVCWVGGGWRRRCWWLLCLRVAEASVEAVKFLVLGVRWLCVGLRTSTCGVTESFEVPSKARILSAVHCGDAYSRC